MNRLTVWFNDNKNYVSTEVEEFHEDGDFIKAYNSHNELVALFRTESIKGAYITEQRKEQKNENRV